MTMMKLAIISLIALLPGAIASATELNNDYSQAPDNDIKVELTASLDALADQRACYRDCLDMNTGDYTRAKIKCYDQCFPNSIKLDNDYSQAPDNDMKVELTASLDAPADQRACYRDCLNMNTGDYTNAKIKCYDQCFPNAIKLNNDYSQAPDNDMKVELTASAPSYPPEDQRACYRDCVRTSTGDDYASIKNRCYDQCFPSGVAIAKNAADAKTKLRGAALVSA